MNLIAHDVTAEDGTRLRVWEDAPASDEADASTSGEPTDCEPATDEAVLFVHGAITHSRALFAPPVETDGAGSVGDDSDALDTSYSWLRATAEVGRTAYALDVRGYGDSEFPPEMTDPPEANDPPVRAADAEADVAAAFDFAAERHAAVHVVGVSWGTMTTGRFFAARDPDAASYVQCAPVYDPPYEFAEGIAALGLDPELDAYFEDDRETVSERKDADENPALFEGTWHAMVESGQGDAADREDAYVAQTGALADVRECCAGNPPYDPGEIATPTLVVRGSDDDVAQRSDALTLYDELGAAGSRKEYAELAGADHYAMHGDRRRALFDLVTDFQDRNSDFDDRDSGFQDRR
jgi:pimeloyl-ACP methyl ester carboxylesterase